MRPTVSVPQNGGIRWLGMSTRDTPEARRKIVRLYLLLALPAFAFCYVLAAIQGANGRLSALLGTIALAGCLVCAAAYHLLGPSSKQLLYVAAGVLALVTFFVAR
ncbi:hypothetical protein Snov_0108 [Ancylobacter novellus DSM 506]|uniref:Uncharacterized protein n=2 Tax=Ancylobacter novellus TaxID=921 RepID=D7A0T5_ANCN5|nr:hypothetical protein Snov_0108 [Ancylobacter novellus DSM 506]